MTFIGYRMNATKSQLSRFSSTIKRENLCVVSDDMFRNRITHVDYYFSLSLSYIFIYYEYDVGRAKSTFFLPQQLSSEAEEEEQEKELRVNDVDVRKRERPKKNREKKREKTHLGKKKKKRPFDFLLLCILTNIVSAVLRSIDLSLYTYQQEEENAFVKG